MNILYASLPLYLWVNFVDIFAYLINKDPSTTLDGGILEEIWIRKMVNYSFIRVFGCEDFVHIDKENNKKLDAKSQKCYFIG